MFLIDVTGQDHADFAILAIVAFLALTKFALLRFTMIVVWIRIRMGELT